MKEFTDTQLVELFLRTREPKYFGELYERHFEKVYKFVLHKVEQRETAEDIVSEVFSALIDALNRFDNKSAVGTFIYAIAKHKVQQHWEKMGKQRSIKLDEQISVEAKPTSSANLTSSLQRLLNKLPTTSRKVLELRYLQQQSIKQTAAKLNLTIANVRVIQHRAIKILKDAEHKV